MRTLDRAFAVSLAALCGCGLENFINNAGHAEFDRPASKIRGAAPWPGAAVSQISVIDGDGNAIKPFLATLNNGAYELRLPSSKYSMIRVRARAGNMELRAIVPFVGEESAVDAVDLDAKNTAETLIAEARLSADAANGALDANFKKVSPDAYVATRQLIRSAMGQTGPTQDFLGMVARFIKPVGQGGRLDPNSGVADPDFFQQPVLDKTYKVTASPLAATPLLLNPFDYAGDGRPRNDSADFDAKLAANAKLYSPTGCSDPDHIRVVFKVNFNPGDLKDGACGSLLQFKWATNKPNKQMFFVGWIHKDSDIQPNDPNPQLAADTQAFYNAMGIGTPNTIKMFDDGTNGDEKAGDNIWTVTFVAPRSKPGKVLRIGYKYTWGFQGAEWSGSEEWPGNSRILEIVDDNKDDFVYRRDVWADEATNKDHQNLNPYGTGNIDWKTDLTGCGTPESHENQFYAPESCNSANPRCKPVPTPKALGPLKVACQGH
jgi:hypothetical protein